MSYNSEQVTAFNSVVGFYEQLVAIEGLNARRHQPHIGLEAWSDATLSDLELDSHPPYSSVEEGLRTALRGARLVGLNDDPVIVKLAEISELDRHSEAA